MLLLPWKRERKKAIKSCEMHLVLTDDGGTHFLHTWLQLSWGSWQVGTHLIFALDTWYQIVLPPFILLLLLPFCNRGKIILIWIVNQTKALAACKSLSSSSTSKMLVALTFLKEHKKSLSLTTESLSLIKKQSWHWIDGRWVWLWGQRGRVNCWPSLRGCGGSFGWRHHVGWHGSPSHGTLSRRTVS